MREIEILQGREYKYLLLENKLYRCSKKYENTTLKLFKKLKDGFITELVFVKIELA